MRTSRTANFFSLTIFSFAAAFMCGCSLPFKFEPAEKAHYRLTAELTPAVAQKPIPKRLALREILSTGFIDSHRILFTREPGQVGSYQYASWVELPAKQLTDLLLYSLQQAKLFNAVTRITSGAVSDLQLNTELREFVHDVSGSRTSVHVTLACEIVDLQTRDIPAVKVFDIVEPVDSNNAEGAFKGFNRATDRLLQEVIAWLEAEMPRE